MNPPCIFHSLSSHRHVLDYYMILCGILLPPPKYASVWHSLVLVVLKGSSQIPNSFFFLM